MPGTLNLRHAAPCYQSTSISDVMRDVVVKRVSSRGVVISFRTNQHLRTCFRQPTWLDAAYVANQKWHIARNASRPQRISNSQISTDDGVVFCTFTMIHNHDAEQEFETPIGPTSHQYHACMFG